METTIKVAIADLNPLYRAGVRSILTQQPGISVVAEVDNFDQLNDVVVSNEVSVVILNLSFAAVSSLEFLNNFASKYPTVPVISIGMLSEEAYAARVLRAGGAAYLKLDCSPSELVEAVRVVRNGRMYLSTRASTAVIEQLQNRNSHRSLHAGLSDREYQIFTMICRGVPLVKIGVNFGISVKTVSTYRARILKKMNMNSNAELIQYAVRHQIVESISA